MTGEPPRAGAAGRATSPVTAARPRGGGWTLIELTVVVALISVLAGLAMAGYRTAVTRAREAVLKEDLFRMRDAIDQYYADRNEYPGALDDLVTYGYVRAIPVDPFTASSATWQVEPAPVNLDDPLRMTSGVYDVRSGSDGVALDGSAYSTW